MKQTNDNSTVRGDERGFGDAGTGTGMNGDTYGASLSPDATNRKAGIGSATKSDPPEETCAGGDC